MDQTEDFQNVKVGLLCRLNILLTAWLFLFDPVSPGDQVHLISKQQILKCFL